MKIMLTNLDEHHDLLINADTIAPGKSKEIEFEQSTHLALYKQPVSPAKQEEAKPTGGEPASEPAAG